jgi:hypothetical protein
MASSLRAPTVLVLLALAALPRCGCDSPPSGAVQDCTSSSVVPGAVATDILFVIDDSQSMDPFQTRLRDALSRFIRDLNTSAVANDFRIGVTTTSVEDYGGGRTYPNNAYRVDGTPFPRGIVVAIDPAVNPADVATWGDFLWSSATGFTGPRILPADPATLVSDFERNVLVGAEGSGREEPFAAIELALGEQLAAGRQNEGFLRPGARLAVVFLSDEDDCSGPQDTAIQSNQACRDARAAGSSLVPVSHYASVLANAGGEPRDVVVAAIVGVTCTGGVCTNTLCTGTPRGATTTPDRFLELLGAFPAASTRLASICDANFDQTLSDIAGAIASQTLPLHGTPADWRLLAASVERPGLGSIPCTIAPVTADAATRTQADALYQEPQEGGAASLTFQNDCALQQGDKVDVQVVCVR